MKITEYSVVEDHDLKNLATKANSLIDKGWQPFGGLQLSVTVLKGDIPAPLYAQAMVKYSSP